MQSESELVCFSDDLISTANGTMHVLQAGSTNNEGFDIVLVHGLIVSSGFMMPTARHLALNHRVIVPDLLGHGKSETPQRPLTIVEQAQSVASVLTELNVERSILVGGSFGCHVAVELFSWLDVEALAFVGPTPGGKPAQSFAQLAQDAMREPADLIFSVLAEVARIGPARVFDLLEDMAQYPFHERLREITSPTLVITGEYDPFFDASFMDETSRVLKSTESLCMPGVAHGLPFTEPELISLFVEQFIARMKNEDLRQAA